MLLYVCIFFVQQIWSHFQKIYITKFHEYFWDRVVYVPLIHNRKMRAVEIIGTEDCHTHVLYESMKTFDHDCKYMNNKYMKSIKDR